MDKQVAQALFGLIPSLTGPLPPELSELATSLLAQSRSKASSLKAEEEIARSYACANIACERLKQNLALPKIEPHPPCPPKVYQKLYKYLDGALPTGTRRSSRSSRRDSAATPTGSNSKHVRPDKPAQNINSRRRTAAKVASKEEVPAWVMPVIRHMCKKLAAPAAPHHILAGVSSILSSQSLDHEAIDINVPALITVLYIFVVSRLTGVATEPAEFLQRKKLALTAVKEAIAQHGESVGCEQDDVDICMRQIGENHWTEMDWFSNMEVGSGLGRKGADQGEDEGTGEGADDEADEGHVLPVQSRGLVSMGSEEEDYLQAGLGTMMDDRVDYLSDARRLSYQRWKTEMLLQIDELEAHDPTMDTGDG